MRLFLILFILIQDNVVMAAGGEGIPWSMITAQAVNVILTIIILVWLLKDKIKQLFVGRVEKFDEEFKKAQRLKESAIQKRDEVKNRLEQLKVNADKSISEAKENSSVSCAKLIEEANDQAKRMTVDTENKILNQKNKMMNELKVELLAKSFNKAREGLSESMSQVELAKLNDDFIKNVTAVQ